MRSGSGRAHIQAREQENDPVARATYFQNLASPRRRQLAAAVSDSLFAKLSRLAREAGVDHLRMFPELAGRAIFAGDGHYVEHASHSPRDSKGRHVAFGVIYSFDLSSGLALPVCDIASGETMHPNEWALMKKSDRRVLDAAAMARKGWDSSRRPILVYDRAGADGTHMGEKAALGAMGFDMITRLKDNMRPALVSEMAFDKGDMANEGVVSDWEVTLACGAALRMVTYKCPETRKTYNFITTERSLRPGVIAWLYRARWRVEKVFDVMEQKLGQDKAWHSSGLDDGIRSCQADFICMGYNILHLIEILLAAEAGIENRKAQDKRDAEIDARVAAAATETAKRTSPQRTSPQPASKKGVQKKVSNKKAPYKKVPELLREFVQQWHQMTRQFIRCFQNLFRSSRTIVECFCDYRRYLSGYI
jgi:hypothetical protein